MTEKLKILITRYSLVLFVFWTLVISGLLIRQIHLTKKTIFEMAVNEARTNFNKDKAFRFWGALHGGVYVPVTDKTPPNPFLAHVKERDIETPSGKKLTLMNSAYMVRQLSETYSKLYGVIGHVTSLKPLRPENAPDEWEKRVLLSFEKGEKEALELSEIDGKPYLRLMHPMITKKQCLKCHGFQGYKEGDIRGGVGISFPMEAFIEKEREQNNLHILSFGLLWFLGVIGIVTGQKWLRQRQSAERAREKSEVRVQFLEKVSPVGIFHTDENGDYISTNETWCDLTGMSPESVLGKGWVKALHPEDYDRIITNWYLSTKNEVPFQEEYRFLRPDGTIIWVFGQALAEKETSGNVSGYIGTITDITDIKKAGEALSNIASGVIGTTSEEIFRSLVRALATTIGADYALIGTVDEDTNIVKTIALYGNGTIMDNIEYDIKDTPCETVFTEETCFYSSNVQDKFPDDRLLVEMGIESYIGKRLVVSPNKIVGLIATFSTNPIKESELAHNMLKIFSVRASVELERLLIEKEKQDLWNQLLQSQKMESVGRLAGGIAHDFNNILTGILGYSELALKDVDIDSPTYRRISIIHEGCQKAARLTKQLLAFSRKQVLDIRLNNLNLIVEGMVKMLSRIIGEDVTLKLLTNQAVKNVRVDDSQIEQIIMNLVVNARSAMPTGGTLIIATKDVTLDDIFAKTHQGAKAGGYVTLSVSDTGIGMSKEIQGEIFEPFFTTKKEGEGTGLGLSTVFGIVKQHNGFIFVHSKPGEGTTFELYFPIAEGSIQVKGEHEDSELSLKGGTETILIVDDDEAIRRLVEETLSSISYNVLNVKNGGEAITVIDTYQGKIDLLFTDVVMPGISGWDLYLELKKTRPDLKVIFTSGFLNNPIVLHNIMEEGIPFINKPFTVAELASKIREVLNKKE